MQFSTHSVDETENIGRRLAAQLKPGDVVAFFGDLGAGKTAFIRGMAAGLGISDQVTSPTYTIVNEYDGPLPLFHFDLYRLSGFDDLFDIGWEDYLARNGVIAAEWSERAPGEFSGCIRVTMDKTGENDRLITIDGGEGLDMPGD